MAVLLETRRSMQTNRQASKEQKRRLSVFRFQVHAGYFEWCYVCYVQSSEKYLKAIQEELGLAIARTHILKDLLALLAPHHPSLAPLRRGLTFLTRFAVETRYPGDWASKRQAASAVRWAGRVRDVCR